MVTVLQQEGAPAPFSYSGAQTAESRAACCSGYSEYEVVDISPDAAPCPDCGQSIGHYDDCPVGMGVLPARMLELQTIATPRSKLTVIEKLPFEIKRVYYLHGIDPDVARAGHAHKDLRRLLIAVHGRFTVRLDGELFTLNDPSQALPVEPLQWLEFGYISPDAVVLVIASKEHDEADCIRSKEELQQLKAAN